MYSAMIELMASVHVMARQMGSDQSTFPTVSRAKVEKETAVSGAMSQNAVANGWLDKVPHGSSYGCVR